MKQTKIKQTKTKKQNLFLLFILYVNNFTKIPSAMFL